MQLELFWFEHSYGFEVLYVEVCSYWSLPYVFDWSPSGDLREAEAIYGELD